jgi:hypothetical protein
MSRIERLRLRGIQSGDGVLVLLGEFCRFGGFGLVGKIRFRS